MGTQHPQHKPVVLLLLAAGKAVLCEKPLGVNAAEVREMVAEARSRGLFLMEVRAEGPSHSLGSGAGGMAFARFPKKGGNPHGCQVGSPCWGLGGDASSESAPKGLWVLLW